MQHQCRYDIKVDLDQIYAQHEAFIAERTGVNAETQGKVWEADEEFWLTRPYWVIVGMENTPLPQGDSE